MSGENERERQAQLSARVVEEGYVTLQERMHTYRRARNQGNSAAGLAPDTNPVIVLQDAVESFFSLIRPYVEGGPRLREYWRGALAQHPDEQHASPERALAYYREHSTGVWQTQKHTKAISAQQLNQATGGQAAVADGGAEDPGTWHSLLGLPETTRVLYTEPAFEDEAFTGYYAVQGRFAVVGLGDIKHWQVRTKTERGRGGGFMSGETATREVREPEPAAKVETAAEMLVDVADELGAIATYEPSGETVHGTPVPDDT